MLDNGHLLFFVNGSNVLYGGPTAGSRVIHMDPATKEFVWEYRASPTVTFFSWFISSHQAIRSSGKEPGGDCSRLLLMGRLSGNISTPFLRGPPQFQKPHSSLPRVSLRFEFIRNWGPVIERIGFHSPPCPTIV